MNRFTAVVLASVAAGVLPAQAADGLLSIESAHTVSATADRLEAKVKAADFRVFARIDHGAGASSVDMPLRPTELLIFGNPKGGTVLMQGGQTVGIDLPLKYLVWQDDGGRVLIGWNDPAWIAARHGIEDRAPVIGKMQGALQKFATEAAAP